jgi:hypothetical protein
MNNTKVTQVRPQSIQNGNPNSSTNQSVFNKVSTMQVSPGIKQPVYARSGTETMGQLARLLRAKLPR